MTAQSNKITVGEHGIVFVEEHEQSVYGGRQPITVKRYAIAPGEFVGHLPLDVQEACARAHTEQVIAEFKSLVLSTAGEK